MNLSRLKPVATANSSLQEKTRHAQEKRPVLEDLIAARNYVGAMTLLEFLKSGGGDKSKQEEHVPLLPWMGYCLFHMGEFTKAMEIYKIILKEPQAPLENHLYLAACLLYMGHCKDALVEAEKGPPCALQYRILFNIAHRLNDEPRLIECHKNLDLENPKSPLENQLCFAAVYFLRNHHEEAAETYKKLILEHPDFGALSVYLATCYLRLDYYDLSLDCLNPYLAVHPRSPMAVNLKACNHYKLFSTGKGAEEDLKALQDADGLTEAAKALIAHNRVVFRGGEGALQVLPPLVDVIPEARLNLVIFHLRNDDIQDAYALMKDFNPTTPQEYVLKAVVNCFVGQLSNREEHLKIAQHFFNLVGSSPVECDTISGRQAMASAFFLQRQWDDVLVYLKSIRTFFVQDDNFNYNFGVALAATGQFKEAEEAFLAVTGERTVKDFAFQSWLARCHIMNRRPEAAWDLYIKMEPNAGDSLAFLQLIGNDCYTTGQFFFAAKAFDVLERLDPNPEYLDAKRGASAGFFQQVVVGRAPRDQLPDIIEMLRNVQGNACERMVQVMRQWLARQ